MRRTKNALADGEVAEGGPIRRARSGSKEYLQLPSIEITPSSDEDVPWSNCSTPSASPRRKRFLLKKWLRVRERKDHGSESRSVRRPAPAPRVPGSAIVGFLLSSGVRAPETCRNY